MMRLRRTVAGYQHVGLAVVLAAASLTGVAWMLAAERAGYEQAQATEEARSRTDHLVLAYEQQVLRTLQMVDQTVRFVRYQYLIEGAGFGLRQAYEGWMHRQFFAYASVIDANGRAVLGTSMRRPIDVSDREYFRFHGEQPDDVLHLGPLTPNRIDGRPSLQITRRIDGPDGRFIGVALVAVPPEVLVDAQRHLAVGEHGIVMLVGLDGRAPIRRAGEEIRYTIDMRDSLVLELASREQAGSYVSRGRLDGHSRFVSYRRLEGYPFLVMVGLSVEESLASANARGRGYYLAALAATLLVLIAAAALLAAMQRRRSAEREKQRADARYRATFDQAAVGVAHADAGGRFLRVNRKLCEILGYPEEELLRLSWIDVTHPDDVRRTLEFVGRMTADPAAVAPELEKRYRCKDGSDRWGIASLSAVRGPDGAPEYFVTVLQDVTERKRAETGARESEERFRQLAENIREVFWLTDPAKNQILYVSPAYEQIWGRTRASVYASPRDWLEAIHQEDRERVLAAAQKQAGGDYFEEYRIVRPDGSTRWIRDRAFPVQGEGGAVYRIAGIAEDITEERLAADTLRESERRFRDMLGNIALVSLMLDCDARITYCNDHLLRLTGWTREEVLGRNWFEVFIPAGNEGLKEVFAALLADMPQYWHHENEILTRRGERRMIRWNNSVLRSAAGEVIGTASIGEDVTERRAAEAALRASEEQFQQLAHNIPQAFWIVSAREHQVIYVSPAYERIIGTAAAPLEHVWRQWKPAIHPEDRVRVLDAYRAMRDGKLDVEHRIVRGDGEVRWVRVQGFPVCDEHGEVVRVAGTVEDITERKLAQDEIVRGEARYRATFDQAGVGIAHATLEGRFVKLNARFCAMLGYAESELLGRGFDEVTHPDDRPLSLDMARAVLNRLDGVMPQHEKRYLHKDGHAVWAEVAASLVRDAGGSPDYFIAMVNDISARKRAEEKLVHQAHHDALTDLPNRTLFHDRLAQAISQAQRHGWSVGVMIVDVDRFKTVNDTLGHDHGDLLLQQIARRLSHCVRAGDTVARVGGDEFAVIAAALGRAQDAATVAQKIVDALAMPFELHGHEVFVSASAGIATFPIDGRDGSALVKNADAAMFRAKDLGRNNYQFYTAAMNERAMENLLLENDLRRALERDEFRLYLQPKASLRDGSITGFEALLRWQRPGHGLEPPGRFVPLLEDTGLIVPAGEWVIRAAFARLREWRRQGLQALPIAVNLGAKQFVHRDVVALVDQAAREFDVPAELIEVEITESDAMKNPEQTFAVLRKLEARGVRISIDDFGTGYSSLSYLKRFPVDALKLDRSFVAGLPEDAEDASIALAVITMAHSLGLEVVAEGVETAAQREFLARHGCDQMQGYLLSRPVPAHACTRLLPGGAESPAEAPA